MRAPRTSEAPEPVEPDSKVARLAAECFGTAFLLATVVGSGIMGERLAGGNEAIALLANSLATGAGLIAILLTLGPISGAHLNPAVSLALAARGEPAWTEAPFYIGAQCIGALLGSRHRAESVPAAVAAYIMGAYWFTASTSFANPAVTLARAFTDTFTGIRPGDIAGFVVAQMAAVAVAVVTERALTARRTRRRPAPVGQVKSVR